MRKHWPFETDCVRENDRAALIRTLETAHEQGHQVFSDGPGLFGGIASDGSEVRIFSRNGWEIVVSKGSVDDAVSLSYGVNASWAFDFFLRCLSDPSKCIELKEEGETWPLPSLIPAESMTAEHKKPIAFLDRAFRQGLESYVYHQSSFGARSSNGREGLLIHRGSRWLVDLFQNKKSVASQIVNDFDEGAGFVLKWLSECEVPVGFSLHKAPD